MTDLSMQNQIRVTTFYRFAPVADCAGLRERWLQACLNEALLGTILIAPEGINGTVSGDPACMDRVLRLIQSEPGFEALDCKHSWVDTPPFLRMKIKLKEEIITMGVPEADPSEMVGEYVDARQWNELLADPDVLVMDTRNDYEVRVGGFRGARDPGMQSFREFPGFVDDQLDPRKHRKVAMFCTGGIRCEKASAYMKLKGFDEVYHLQGGILRYLEDVQPADSLWDGDCFVFDQRVSVGHDLQPGEHILCPGCREAVSVEEQSLPGYEQGVSCARCADTLSAEQRARFANRDQQERLARQRGDRHIGKRMPERTRSTAAPDPLAEASK